MPVENEMTVAGYRRWFTSEGAFYRLLLVVGGGIAVLKGLHMPYSWPATQAQIDYRYGFLRRGLFGEACRQLHVPIWRYGVFSALCFVLLAGFLVLLGWCVRRSGLDRAGMGAFSALMAGSFCVSLLVNLVGFYDIVMALLVLMVLLVKRPGVQLVAAALAGIVGVLVHELYAIVFLPVTLIGAVSWAGQSVNARAGLRWRRWLGVAAAALTPWMIVVAISRQAAMTVAQNDVLKAAIRERVNFEPFDAMLEVLTFSGRDNLQLMLRIMHSGSWWVEQMFGAAAFLPTAVFFLAIAWRLAVGRGWVLRGWLVVATFAPLVLNFEGFDLYRWQALMTLNAFLAAIAMAFSYRRSQRRDLPVFGVGWRRAAVFLLMLNLATDVGFFEARARSFPFQDYWTDYREAKQAHRPWLAPTELLPKHIR